MFAEHLSVGFYWGPRQDGLKLCTDSATQFIVSLQKMGPLFSNWYESFTREHASKMSLSTESIRRLLLSGISCGDIGSHPLPGAGYPLTIYNGNRQDKMVKLSLLCNETSPLLNSCVLQSPAGTDAQRELAQPNVVLSLCRLMAVSWNPDFGMVTCYSLRESIGMNGDVAEAGWIMYRSFELGRLPKLPDSARVEQIKDRGHLIVASEDITIPPMPQAIADVRAVYQALGPAQALDHTRKGKDE